jgi:two-component system, NarL family, sensor histidine kinase UhpB
MKISIEHNRVLGAISHIFPWQHHMVRCLRSVSFRSLRTRLLAMVLLIDCIAAILTTTVVILNARTNTKREIASSMQLAVVLVSDTIRLLEDTPTPVLLKSIDLHFQSVRHIKISVVDSLGRSVAVPASSSGQSDDADNRDAPEWFSRLIAPPIERNDFPVVLRGQKIGMVTITSEPSDEINEAWNYVRALVTTALYLNMAVLAILFLLFGRILEPVTRIVSGLKQLEDKNYSVRLPRPSMTELALMTDHFNKAAEALAEAHQANRRLNWKLLTAQDEERRRTALELHDEVGPFLFALEANATSVASMTADIGGMSRLRERALEIVEMVSQIQSINRRLLDRLRPMALGKIPLKECLIKLFVDFDGVEKAAKLEQTIGSLQESYGALVDLTIYRCVQEGIFNAIRHAHARRIVLSLGQREVLGRQVVVIRISDDGVGLKQPFQPGVGLTGMRERVEALSGLFEIETSLSGTVLTVVLPADGSEILPAVLSKRLFS